MTTRRAKLRAMAETEGYNPEEAAIARTKLESTALVALSNAKRALAEATSLVEMRNVRDMAVTLKAGAKARGMGIDSENLAAEVVIRAERAMGFELERIEARGRFADESRRGPLLADLGISKDASSQWQRLARIPDPIFERMVLAQLDYRDNRGNPQRLSRANLADEFFGKERPQKKQPVVSSGTPQSDDFTLAAENIEASAQWMWDQMERGRPIRSDYGSFPELVLRINNLERAIKQTIAGLRRMQKIEQEWPDVEAD